MNPNPGTRPTWVDDQLYPFESRFIDIAGNNVHYVDEGDGPTLLLLHGNPTWSFLYRLMIPDLSDDFRCIALDYPGFGLSQAAAGYRFLPREHSAVVQQFVTALDLHDITLMVQDWGGPIGVNALLDDRGRYRRLIVGNTWIWPTPSNDLFVRTFSAVLGGPVGRQLIRRFNLFVEQVLPRGFVRKKPTGAEMDHWRGPFPTPESREPTAVLPKEIVKSRAFLEGIVKRADTLADLEALIVWADKDVAFREPVKRRWQATLPKATTVDIRGAGHFLQDDASDDVVDAIRTWWKGLASS